MELFYIILALLVIARGLGELAERFGQPALVGELIAGMILGVVTTAFADTLPVLAALPENEVFVALTDLGIFFLMLLAGMEMQPAEFANSSRAALMIAGGGFFLPLLCGLSLGVLILPESDLQAIQTLFLAVALSITAVPVTVRVLLDLRLLQTRAGQTIVSAAVIDDIVSLILLAILTAMINTGSAPSLGALGILAAKIVIFFLVTAAIGLFLLPGVAKFVRRFKVDELEFSFLLIVGLAFALLADLLELHFIIGAFVAGLFFEASTFDKDIYTNVKRQVSGITTGFLAPIFFISIGYHLDLFVVTAQPLILGALVFLAFAGKILGAALPARYCGFSTGDALFIGAGMTARGAVELIIAEIALQKGVFEQPADDPVVSSLFSAVVLMTLVTTIGAPIIMNYLKDADHADHSSKANTD